MQTIEGFALALAAATSLTACGGGTDTIADSGAGCCADSGDEIDASAGDAEVEDDGGAPADGDVLTEPRAADRLVRYLVGAFDSSAQAGSNPRYYSVQLATCRVFVPDLGEAVLYVEQAMMDTPDAPYRQRLYVIEPGGQPALEAVSQVWELRFPRRAVGLCRDPGALSLRRDDAVERDGCAAAMRWVGDHFEGGTDGHECTSTLNGASYATSEVALYEDRMESWDRGYDDRGEQVWGALDGPYIFDRVTEMDPE